MLYGIILAAGASKRYNYKEKKQFVKIKNKPILSYSIEKFINTKKIDKLIIVLNNKDFDKDANLCKDILKHYNNNLCFLVKGGKERYDSVFNALNFINDNYGIKSSDKIIIHDAARPNVDVKDIFNLISKLKKYNSITLGYPLSDSIKEINKSSNKNIVNIKKTINRKNYYLISTPQGFNLNLLFNSYNKFYKINNKEIYNITDDTQIIELFSKSKSYVLNSSRLNYKITLQDDLNMLKYII